MRPLQALGITRICRQGCRLESPQCTVCAIMLSKRLIHLRACCTSACLKARRLCAILTCCCAVCVSCGAYYAGVFVVLVKHQPLKYCAEFNSGEVDSGASVILTNSLVILTGHLVMLTKLPALCSTVVWAGSCRTAVPGPSPNFGSACFRCCLAYPVAVICCFYY